jgi:hypothetical protein
MDSPEKLASSVVLARLSLRIFVMFLPNILAHCPMLLEIYKLLET